MGGEFGGEWIHVYICSPETVTTLLIGYTLIKQLKKKRQNKESMKQNAKQTLQNIQHSQTSKTQKKIELHSHLLSECGCPDVTSLALFSL